MSDSARDDRVRLVQYMESKPPPIPEPVEPAEAPTEADVLEHATEAGAARRRASIGTELRRIAAALGADTREGGLRELAPEDPADRARLSAVELDYVPPMEALAEELRITAARVSEYVRLVGSADFTVRPAVASQAQLVNVELPITDAVQVLGSDPARFGIVLYPVTDADSIFVGFDERVTATNGLPADTTGVAGTFIPYNGDLYVATDAAGTRLVIVTYYRL